MIVVQTTAAPRRRKRLRKVVTNHRTTTNTHPVAAIPVVAVPAPPAPLPPRPVSVVAPPAPAPVVVRPRVHKVTTTTSTDLDRVAPVAAPAAPLQAALPPAPMQVVQTQPATVPTTTTQTTTIERGRVVHLRPTIQPEQRTVVHTETQRTLYGPDQPNFGTTAIAQTGGPAGPTATTVVSNNNPNTNNLMNNNLNTNTNAATETTSSTITATGTDVQTTAQTARAVPDGTFSVSNTINNVDPAIGAGVPLLGPAAPALAAGQSETVASSTATKLGPNGEATSATATSTTSSSPTNPVGTNAITNAVGPTPTTTGTVTTTTGTTTTGMTGTIGPAGTSTTNQLTTATNTNVDTTTNRVQTVTTPVVAPTSVAQATEAEQDQYETVEEIIEDVPYKRRRRKREASAAELVRRRRHSRDKRQAPTSSQVSPERMSRTRPALDYLPMLALRPRLTSQLVSAVLRPSVASGLMPSAAVPIGYRGNAVSELVYSTGAVPIGPPALADWNRPSQAMAIERESSMGGPLDRALTEQLQVSNEMGVDRRLPYPGQQQQLMQVDQGRQAPISGQELIAQQQRRHRQVQEQLRRYRLARSPPQDYMMMMAPAPFYDQLQRPAQADMPHTRAMVGPDSLAQVFGTSEAAQYTPVDARRPSGQPQQQSLIAPSDELRPVSVVDSSLNKDTSPNAYPDGLYSDASGTIDLDDLDHPSDDTHRYATALGILHGDAHDAEPIVQQVTSYARNNIPNVYEADREVDVPVHQQPSTAMVIGGERVPAVGQSSAGDEDQSTVSLNRLVLEQRAGSAVLDANIYMDPTAAASARGSPQPTVLEKTFAVKGLATMNCLSEMSEPLKCRLVSLVLDRIQ